MKLNVKKIIVYLIIIVLLINVLIISRIIINDKFIESYSNNDIDQEYRLIILTSTNINEPYIAHYNYGNYYYKLGRYEDAYNKYLKALDYKIPDNRYCSVKINISLALMKLAENESSNSLKFLLEAKKHLQDCIDFVNDNEQNQEGGSGEGGDSGQGDKPGQNGDSHQGGESGEGEQSEQGGESGDNGAGQNGESGDGSHTEHGEEQEQSGGQSQQDSQAEQKEKASELQDEINGEISGSMQEGNADQVPSGHGGQDSSGSGHSGSSGLSQESIGELENHSSEGSDGREDGLSASAFSDQNGNKPPKTDGSESCTNKCW